MIRGAANAILYMALTEERPEATAELNRLTEEAIKAVDKDWSRRVVNRNPDLKTAEQSNAHGQANIRSHMEAAIRKYAVPGGTRTR